jgi:hypothetical protein
MSRAYSTDARDGGSIKNSVRKCEVKRSIGRPRHRWENIRLDLRDIVWKCLDWMHLAQDRDQWRVHEDTVINLSIPYNAVIFLTS